MKALTWHGREDVRVVVPFGIACGSCVMCRAGLHSQCETAQVRSEGKGAALFGYTRLYGSVPGDRPSIFACFNA